MRNIRNIVRLVSIALSAIALISAIIVFREKLYELIWALRKQDKKLYNCHCCQDEDCSDYAEEEA